MRTTPKNSSFAKRSGCPGAPIPPVSWDPGGRTFHHSSLHSNRKPPRTIPPGRSVESCPSISRHRAKSQSAWVASSSRPGASSPGPALRQAPTSGSPGGPGTRARPARCAPGCPSPRPRSWPHGSRPHTGHRAAAAPIRPPPRRLPGPEPAALCSHAWPASRGCPPPASERIPPAVPQHYSRPWDL
jgi:hypothetical protein